ncbi:hypothetical protein [Ramlibacter sp. AN1133]|uniref:hypothetical protein n=1 Tax=Ramlibacter sp. AN1133 TaxID=3133429 RepID=UPI0030BBD900
MGSHRNAASRISASEGRACADALPLEEGQADKDKITGDGKAPRAGRTGNLGARAERPAENRAHKSNSGGAEPTRRDKPPSPAADEGPPGRDEPPRPRDSAG